MNLKLTGDRIKEMRDAKGLSGSELANLLAGFEKGYEGYDGKSKISKWENGKGKAIPPLKKIIELSYILDCTPEYLLGIDPHPNATTSWVSEQIPFGRITIEALKQLNNECIERRNKYGSTDTLADDSLLTAFIADFIAAQIILDQDSGGINETLLSLIHQLVEALKILAEWESIKKTDKGGFVFGKAMSSPEEYLKLRNNPPERYRMAKWEKEMCEKKIGELFAETISESLKLFTYYGMEKEEADDHGNI